MLKMHLIDFQFLREVYSCATSTETSFSTNDYITYLSDDFRKLIKGFERFSANTRFSKSLGIKESSPYIRRLRNIEPLYWFITLFPI